jgi:hypothetical protein
VAFWDAVLGRRKVARPNLDSLFALPAAAITLQVEFDLKPTGRGSVAFRAPEGRAFADVAAEVRALLDASGGPACEVVADEHGFDWMVVHTDPPDVPALVTDLHAVNATLVNAGFGPQLLCSLVGFVDPQGTEVAVIYQFKRGTFYPFAPMTGSTEQRNNVLELQLRDRLTGELPLEERMENWFAVWGAPGFQS